MLLVQHLLLLINASFALYYSFSSLCTSAQDALYVFHLYTVYLCPGSYSWTAYESTSSVLTSRSLAAAAMQLNAGFGA